MDLVFDKENILAKQQSKAKYTKDKPFDLKLNLKSFDLNCLALVDVGFEMAEIVAETDLELIDGIVDQDIVMMTMSLEHLDLDDFERMDCQMIEKDWNCYVDCFEIDSNEVAVVAD